MLGSVCKAAYRVRSASQALGVLTRAAVDALSPPMGPVSVEVPIDLQRVAIPRPAVLDEFALPLAAPRAPAAGELDELAARVLAARRPMLWVGRGARDAGPAVRRLLDLGFTMVEQLAGAGARAGGRSALARRAARGRHAGGRGILARGRSAGGGGGAAARARDRGFLVEAAGEPDPDRCRSVGERAHLSEPVFRLWRRGAGAGGAGGADRGTFSCRSRVPARVRAR